MLFERVANSEEIRVRQRTWVNLVLILYLRVRVRVINIPRIYLLFCSFYLMVVPFWIEFTGLHNQLNIWIIIYTIVIKYLRQSFLDSLFRPYSLTLKLNPCQFFRCVSLFEIFNCCSLFLQRHQWCHRRGSRVLLLLLFMAKD